MLPAPRQLSQKLSDHRLKNRVDGRPEWIRTIDLFRINLPRLRTITTYNAQVASTNSSPDRRSSQLKTTLLQGVTELLDSFRMLGLATSGERGGLQIRVLLPLQLHYLFVFPSTSFGRRLAPPTGQTPSENRTLHSNPRQRRICYVVGARAISHSRHLMAWVTSEVVFGWPFAYPM
jgi:hypothetical protein